MELKRLLTIMRDLFMPQPRNACPHCGGIRCIGACQFNHKQPVVAEQKGGILADSLPVAVPTERAGAQGPEVPAPARDKQNKD